jgi:hypothetical protein
MIDKGSIVPTDVLGCTVPVEVELSHDLLLHVRIGIGSDDLEMYDQ